MTCRGIHLCKRSQDHNCRSFPSFQCHGHGHSSDIRIYNSSKYAALRGRIIRNLNSKLTMLVSFAIRISYNLELVASVAVTRFFLVQLIRPAHKGFKFPREYIGIRFGPARGYWGLSIVLSIVFGPSLSSLFVGF